VYFCEELGQNEKEQFLFSNLKGEDRKKNREENFKKC
jgi:hypothetical protein